MVEGVKEPLIEPLLTFATDNGNDNTSYFYSYILLLPTPLPSHPPAPLFASRPLEDFSLACTSIGWLRGLSVFMATRLGCFAVWKSKENHHCKIIYPCTCMKMTRGSERKREEERRRGGGKKGHDRQTTVSYTYTDTDTEIAIQVDV